MKEHEELQPGEHGMQYNLLVLLCVGVHVVVIV
jgi:hypothetical protein